MQICNKLLTSKEIIFYFNIAKVFYPNICKANKCKALGLYQILFLANQKKSPNSGLKKKKTETRSVKQQRTDDKKITAPY
jgi:hypothetical protein